MLSLECVYFVVICSLKVSRLKCFSFDLFLRDDIGPFCAWFSFVSVWFLMVLSTFCVLAPDVIAFYLVGHHHWASNVVSWAHVLIPLLWKLDNFASILVVAL